MSTIKIHRGNDAPLSLMVVHSDGILEDFCGVSDLSVSFVKNGARWVVVEPTKPIVAVNAGINVVLPADTPVGNYRAVVKYRRGDRRYLAENCHAVEVIECVDDVTVEDTTSVDVTLRVQFSADGKDGLSAYELAVVNGEYTGDYAGYQKWLARDADAKAADALEVANQNTKVIKTKQDILTLTEKSNGNIIIGNLQGQTKEFMPATPSGDVMHDTYVAAGAVWDDDTQTWSANGKSGLSNSEVRTLYNNSDMNELLFRKFWNKSCLVGTAQECGRYNPITGFYELNGIWDLTFDEAFDIYVRGNKGIVGTSSWNTVNNMRTTLEDGNINFIGLSWCFMEEYNNVHTINDSAYLIPFSNNSQGARIYYCRKLRRITPVIYLYNYSLQTYIVSCKSLKHISLYRPKKSAIINMWNDNEHISYYSLSYLISNANQAFTLNVDANTFAYLSGAADSTLLSQDAVENGYGKIIPYDKNIKVIPDNTFWREELDVKGINGGYIYPSFEEYLAEHPENFATAEEWQALATLAEEKGITIATK